MSLDHARIDATPATLASAPVDPALQSVPTPPDYDIWHPDRPIRLRAHNLLCLQGWEGMGYSPAFTANMDTIHAHLFTHPESEVTLIVGADSLCSACPLLEDQVCHHDRHDGGWISQHDLRTLTHTGLVAGETYPWQTIERAIADAFTGADIATFCARCRWQPLGVCAAGIDRLRDRLATPFDQTTQKA